MCCRASCSHAACPLPHTPTHTTTHHAHTHACCPPTRSCLQLYKDYIDPDFTWSNFSVEEQAKVIVAPRSNNLLDTARFEGEFPELLPIRESLIK